MVYHGRGSELGVSDLLMCVKLEVARVVGEAVRVVEAVRLGAAVR